MVDQTYNIMIIMHTIIDDSNYLVYHPVIIPTRLEVHVDESQALDGNTDNHASIIIVIIDFPDHPRGYRSLPHVPVLRGDDDHCPHCLCALCVINVPPIFLRGQCGPHPANDEKRHRLYRLFWSTLKDLGMWRDDEYLQRKQERTVIGDRRDIIPDCIIMASVLCDMTICNACYL